ncbi:MAG TPA: YCF48-related protein [Ignavibacteriaceae bacterium]|nr:YCF48-related protein [Ignavibacteriaceae bacterium]
MLKRLLFFFILNLLFFPNIFPQEYTNWKWLHQRPQGTELRWVQMYDADTWYMGGMHGLFMKTTDGGQTWFHHAKSSHPYADGDYNQNYFGHFFDKNIGINGGGDAVMRTTDGGVTWKEISYTFSSFCIIWGSHFLNSTTGYVCGDDSIMIHKTTDQGRHWTPIFVPNTDILYAIWVSDDQQLIVCATTHGEIKRSSNGGQSFQTINVGHSGTNYGITFKDKLNGWVCGASGFAAYTTDGGLTWHQADNGIPSYNMNDVDYRNVGGVEQVVVTGSPYGMYATTNMGSSWFRINPRPSSQTMTDYYHATDFLPDGSYVTVGESGLINSKVGSGPVKCHTEAIKTGILWDVWADKPYGKVIAVGEESDAAANDHIMYSTNGGQDWSIVNLSTDDTMRCIRMVNENIGYIVGTGGKIYKTTNGGLNWTSQTSGITSNLYSVDFVSENIGWAVGYGGIVLKTVDGGTTWVKQNSTLPASVYGVDFVNENLGWICGGSGHIRKTTNGGTTWTVETSKVATPLYKIQAASDQVIYAAGSVSKITKSTDGGETWDTLQTPHSFSIVTIHDMEFKDENFGIFGATGSKVLMTTDGGATWKLEFSNNFENYGVDIADDLSNGVSMYVVGYKGSVMVNNSMVTPVELSAFNVTVDESNVNLNWNTSTEKNNSGFSVERKKDNGTFEQISFVEGKGTTTELNSYTYQDKNLANGHYAYRLKQIDFDGTASYSNEVEVNINNLPGKFSLEQNYPNPFNPSTLIKYAVPVQEQVIVKIFDVLGNEVTTLVNEVKPAGKYEVSWDAANYSSGMYLYQIKAGNYTDTKKMLLMK